MGLATLAAVAFGVHWILRPARADFIFVNGRVYTVDDDSSIAEAIAVRGNRIVRVGTSADIQDRYTAPRVIDLRGRPVYPGVVAAQAHIEAIGLALRTVNLGGLSSIVSIKERIAQELASRTRGEWIRGRGWDQNWWPIKEFPTHEALDAVAPENPVYLTRVDGHAVWVNRRVLEIAGITAATADPEGGKIIRDKRGNLTGVFVDNAITLLSGALPPTSVDERRQAILSAIGECTRLGLTEVHDMGVDSLGVQLYTRLIQEGKFPFRIYAAIDGPGPTWDFYKNSGPVINAFEGKLNVRALKMYVDGALGSRGAALIMPYSDDPENRGLTLTPGENLRTAAQECVARGFQMCVHAIGDRANAIALTVYENTFNENGVNGAQLRFRIEHAQVIDAADVYRFRRYGIIPSMQPTHCTSDMPWATARLGAERVQMAYAWRTLLREGNEIPAGSDSPVESPNPLLGFYAAVTRQDPEGKPEGGWVPEQRMTRGEALRAFTLWGARAAFQEKLKGSIEEGKWADIVVLSDDIMTIAPDKIPTTRVELTMVGGEIAYEVGSFAATAGSVGH